MMVITCEIITVNKLSFNYKVYVVKSFKLSHGFVKFRLTINLEKISI
jgi:hypothetical protein